MGSLRNEIYNIYYSELDNMHRQKIIERTHWICKSVEGEKVLDIGCSRGMTSILLGREGKMVTGIDLSEVAISKAIANLQNEESYTKKCVTFEQNNFMLKKFNEKFDCIIIGEVLDYLNDISSFFNKASNLVKEDGKIIVTTSFGLSEYIDHKRIFYLNKFFELQSKTLNIEKINFFGKWIGVVYKKSALSNPALKFDANMLMELEKNFYNIEREYLDQQKKIIENAKKVKEEKEDFERELQQLKEERCLNRENYLQEKAEKVKIQKHFLDELEKEEQILEENRILIKENKILKRQYYSLRNSKLGKLTLRYWNFRNRKRSN